MPTIWSESYLSTLLEEAEKRISSEKDIYWTREALSIVSGQSTYSLSPYYKKITKITWKGKKLEALNYDDAQSITYNSAVVSSGTRNEYTQSEPRFYTFHPNSLAVIRFIPTPNETITPTGAEDLFGTNIATQCIISFYRTTDNSSFVLPNYVSRRFKKAYALYRAFLKEGKGQNLVASKYHKQKFDLLLSYFEKINSGAYVSKRPALTESQRFLGGPPPPPQLPWNYPSRKI